MDLIEKAERILKQAEIAHDEGDFVREAELINIAGSIASVGLLRSQERTNYLLESILNASVDEV